MEQVPAVQNVEQFVTKQDLTGKILACDTRCMLLEATKKRGFVFSQKIKYTENAYSFFQLKTKNEIKRSAFRLKSEKISEILTRYYN